MADSKLLLMKPPSSTSPPPNCAICLGSLLNKCFSDTCLHQFCFKCLLQWSKIKAECPLCKQPFKSIIHNVKSNEEYEEHIVEETTTASTEFNEHFNIPVMGNPGTSRQHQFHFRTTFTVNTHGENAIQQMLLSHSLTNGISISNYMPEQHSIPHYSQRRGRRENYSTTNFRRSIYDNNLWATPLIDVTNSFRDLTPEYFQANPASRTRLAPWLNRELNALLGPDTHYVMFLVDSIMEKLLNYHIRSKRIKKMLQVFLRNRTDHFIYEFYNFMRSPFDMIGYDRHVIYSERPPTPLIELSEDENDVMIVEQNIDVIEVSSDDSDDDVTITSVTAPTKPMPMFSNSTFKKFLDRSRNVEISSSSSSSLASTSSSSIDQSNYVKDEKIVKRKRDSSASSVSSSNESDDIPLARLANKKNLKRTLKESHHHRHREHKRVKKVKKNKKKSERDYDKHRSKRQRSKRDVSSSSNSSCSSSSSSRNSSKCTSSSRSRPKIPSFMIKPGENGLQVVTNTCDKRSIKKESTSSSLHKNEEHNSRYHQYNPKREVVPDYQNWCEGPSTSSLRGKSKKSHQRRKNEHPIKFRLRSRIFSDGGSSVGVGDDLNMEQPLELTNNNRISERCSPKPLMINVNQNAPINVSQSINFFNSTPSSSSSNNSSMDLMDLSVKTERNFLENVQMNNASTESIEPDSSGFCNNIISTNLTNDLPGLSDGDHFHTDLLESFLNWSNYRNNNSENSD